jgi:hypothetical protein
VDSPSNPAILHARVLAEIRRYSVESIIDAAGELLWAEYPNKLEALQIAPWHVLLLVKWALREAGTLRIGRRISADQFTNLRSGIQELVGEDHRFRPPPVYLMLRAHFQQFDFQRPEGWGFLRWPALIAREIRDNPTRRQFVRELGLEPEQFIDLTYILVVANVERMRSLPRHEFEPLRKAYGPAVDKYLGLVAPDLPLLRSVLRQYLAVQAAPLRQELYEFPFLKRHPFFRSRKGDITAWHPLVAARGLEEIVHWRLARLSNEYTEPFSRLFERYVLELAASMSSNTVTEAQYESHFGPEAPKVEAVLPYDHCNVYVEAKMALFEDDVLLTDNETQAFNKTKHVRKAIKQGWEVARQLRGDDSPLPQCHTPGPDFLLVVTSRELGLGSGEQLQRLYPPGRLEYPDEASRQLLPLAHVFTMSILEFERLSVAVANGAVNLPQLLRGAVERNKDPATSAILFDSYLGPYVENWGMPKLLAHARSAAEDRIEGIAQAHRPR